MYYWDASIWLMFSFPKLRLPALAVHRSYFTPILLSYVEYFNGRKAIVSIVTSDGVQLLVHNDHTDTWSHHWHTLGHLPTTHDWVEYLNDALRVSCQIINIIITMLRDSPLFTRQDNVSNVKHKIDKMSASNFRKIHIFRVQHKSNASIYVHHVVHT